VGPLLNTGNLKSFVSRDGGITWTQIIAPGQDNETSSSLFVIAERGALLAYIYNKPDIHTMFYSLDQGITLDSCDFLNITGLSSGDIPDPFMLFTDPDGETTYVTLISAINGTHVLHWFNFTSLIPRDCM